ncbi:MAG: hypothetical protein KDK38_06800 [Leptospiraceae bacterium]|nr:hypothetical protein [Leptospiraceae bacterium]
MKLRFYILTVLTLLSLTGQSITAQDAAELERNQRKKVRKDGTYGTVTLRYTLGFYNFEHNYVNNTIGATRTYSLPTVNLMHGFELAVRLGTDREGYYETDGAGFNYYTSNTGLFTDMEIGMKSFLDGKPNRYNYQQTGGPGATAVRTVDLGVEQEITDGVTVTQFDATQASATGDGINLANRKKYGPASAAVTTVYFNNYYRLTPLNYIMNFGSGFKWFDASLGPSLRINRYVDYGDPVRFLENRNDNTFGTFMIGYRQYIQPIDIIRLRTHYFYPFVGALARAMKDSDINHEEHILDVGLDIYVIDFLYLTFGYEYRYWKTNPSYADRFNRSTGTDFSNTRDGFESRDRESGEFYLGLAIDIKIPMD